LREARTARSGKLKGDRLGLERRDLADAGRCEPQQLVECLACERLTLAVACTSTRRPSRSSTFMSVSALESRRSRGRGADASTTPTETAATESRKVRERPKRSSARIAAT
jgi:hypothetical protein